MHVSNCDDKAAEDLIQGLLKIWNGEKDKDDKCIEDSNNGNNKNDDNNNNKQYSSTAESPLPNELLAAGIHNPAEYVINTINKTVKLDDSLVRAVFYAGCSTWTFDPINLGISAPTSEGKTYTVLQVLQYFPKSDLKYVGSMSPKVIIRQESTLVNVRAIDAIQNDKIRGSLSDSPLGQNNPLDKALRGGDLYTLPSIKTNAGYSFLDRAEEEYEPWALH